MAVTKVRLPKRAKDEFGPVVIEGILRNLHAVDCQICGKALGVRVPALTMMGFDVVHAILHHETCAEPRWAAGVITPAAAAPFPLAGARQAPDGVPVAPGPPERA